MVRGVSFDMVPSSNALYQILKCFDPEKYYWFNIDSQNEAWDGPKGAPLFERDCYDGRSFVKRIMSEHFIAFLKLQAYFKENAFVDIHSYDEFVKSDCQLLLLIYDCESVDIYAKDLTIIKSIYENALINHFSEIQYITENNDQRTKMDIL